MSERIRGTYDDALYKSAYTLLYRASIVSLDKKIIMKLSVIALRSGPGRAVSPVCVGLCI